jgi:hypothetical protein
VLDPGRERQLGLHHREVRAAMVRRYLGVADG